MANPHNPVTIVTGGGNLVTAVTDGCNPVTAVTDGGNPVTLTDSGHNPVTFIGGIGAVATFSSTFTNGTATPAGSAPVGTYTYDRNGSAAWITDFEGLVKEIPIDAIAMRGQRGVDNLIRSVNTTGLARSDNLQGVDDASSSWAAIDKVAGTVTLDDEDHLYWNSTSLTMVDYDVLVSSINIVYAGTDTFVLRLTHGAPAYDPVKSLITGPCNGRYSIKLDAPSATGTASNGFFFGIDNRSTHGADNASKDFILSDVQIEMVSGQSNQNPGDYVSIGVEAFPYHGANVDGVKYFPYENGNTVTGNNVVDELGQPGATIAVPSINKGLEVWESRKNYADTDDDLTGGAETVDLTAGGTGDYTLSVYGSSPAVTVAAVGATGTGFAQATEGNPVTFNLSVAGTVSLTLDSGTLGTDSKGAFYLKQVEKGSFFTPVIESSGAGASTRNADNLNYDSDNYAETGFCLLDFFVTADQLANHATSPTIMTIAETGFVSDWVSAYINDATTVTVDFVTSVGTSTADFTVAAGNQYKIAFTWDKVSGTIRASLDGAAAFDFTGVAAATIRPAADAATIEIAKYTPTQFWNGNILDVELGKTLMTDDELVVWSTI